MANDEFPVEAGHIIMFARSIGDANPIYADSDYAKSTEPGTVVAPPTFVQAGAQFSEGGGSRPVPGKRWHGSGKEPTGSNAPPQPGGDALPAGAAGRMHAEQHFEYHRPIVPGMVLSRRSYAGQEWEKTGRRGGTLRFAESVTEFYDQQGQLVVTTRSVIVRTETVAPEGGASDAAQRI
ncbi:MAG: hypothetical protein EPO16_12090 [Dehalococcoidia bacterium]|nr:MAG: hypothetical protein EPO16_12090 [Dehalococcoidia bacterium]